MSMRFRTDIDFVPAGRGNGRTIKHQELYDAIATMNKGQTITVTRTYRKQADNARATMMRYAAKSHGKGTYTTTVRPYETGWAAQVRRTR